MNQKWMFWKKILKADVLGEHCEWFFFPYGKNWRKKVVPESTAFAYINKSTVEVLFEHPPYNIGKARWHFKEI